MCRSERLLRPTWRQWQNYTTSSSIGNRKALACHTTSLPSLRTARQHLIPSPRFVSRRSRSQQLVPKSCLSSSYTTWCMLSHECRLREGTWRRGSAGLLWPPWWSWNFESFGALCEVWKLWVICRLWRWAVSCDRGVLASLRREYRTAWMALLTEHQSADHLPSSAWQ